MIDTKQLGARLRKARNRRGFSREAVAQRLEVPRAVIASMEDGTRLASVLELVKLAEIYCCSQAFFWRPSEVTDVEDLAVLLHRAIPEMLEKPEVDAAVWEMIDLCREGTILRHKLGQSTEVGIPNYDVQVSSCSEAIRQGKDVADEERGRLGLDAGPIRNIAACIRSQNVWVTAMELPAGISGFFIDYPEFGPSIFVNKDQVFTRRCFSYAHEYAHVLFDRHKPPEASRHDNSHPLLEKRANAFAAAFLMPPRGVHEFMEHFGKAPSYRRASADRTPEDNPSISETINPMQNHAGHDITYRDVAQLSHYFGSSYSAAAWRLRELNYITAADVRDLIEKGNAGKEYIRLLGSSNQSNQDISQSSLDHGIKMELLYLAIEAFHRVIISRGRLIEIGKKLHLDRGTMFRLTKIEL